MIRHWEGCHGDDTKPRPTNGTLPLYLLFFAASSSPSLREPTPSGPSLRQLRDTKVSSVPAPPLPHFRRTEERERERGKRFLVVRPRHILGLRYRTNSVSIKNVNRRETNYRIEVHVGRKIEIDLEGDAATSSIREEDTNEEFARRKSRSAENSSSGIRKNEPVPFFPRTIIAAVKFYSKIGNWGPVVGVKNLRGKRKTGGSGESPRKTLRLLPNETRNVGLGRPIPLPPFSLPSAPTPSIHRAETNRPHVPELERIVSRTILTSSRRLDALFIVESRFVN